MNRVGNCKRKTAKKNYMFGVGTQNIKPDQRIYSEKIMRELKRLLALPLYPFLRHLDVGKEE
jgi:hypothetical protein